MGVNVKITKRISDILLKNGREIPMDFYNQIKKNNPSEDDDTIYNKYIESQRQFREENVSVNNEGICGESLEKEEKIGEKSTTSKDVETIRIEKAKYILEHPTIFSEDDINSAKQVFKL